MGFTQEQADRICSALTEELLTLRQVAEREGISAALIIWNARHDEEFAKRYARAMDVRTERDFEGLEDQTQEEPPKVDGRIDPGWVQWKRLQIDTRKWALSKRNPKKYSEKIQSEVSGPDGGAISVSIELDSSYTPKGDEIQ